MVLRGRKQIDKLGTTHFITTTVKDFISIFPSNISFFDILIENLRFYLNKYSSTLFGYVLMPIHIHFLLFVPEKNSISDFMRDFKKFTSVQIRDILRQNNTYNLLSQFEDKRGEFSLWKDRFDSVVVYSEKVMETKLNYIHYNPVKAGLVHTMIDWKYSSARNYYQDDHSVIFVSTDWRV